MITERPTESEGQARSDQWRAVAPAAVAMGAAVAGVLGAGIAASDGVFVFPLDDPYIHLSTARTLLESGTWSALPYEPSSPSSSIAWPLLLAACGALFGLGPGLVIGLNVVLAAVAVLLAHRFLRQRLSGSAQAAVLVLLVWSTSLSTQAVVGMEHVLQCLAAVSFFAAGLDLLHRNDVGYRPHLVPGAVWLAAPFLVAARYEGLLLVLPFCILLALRRRLSAAMALGLASLLPVGAFAAFSLHVGNYPIPNSLLLKTNLLGIGASRPLSQLAQNLLHAPTVWFASLLCALYLARGAWRELVRPDDERSVMASAAFAGGLAGALHIGLATAGWLYRYEAYLVAVMIVFLVPALGPAAKSRSVPGIARGTVTVGLILILGLLVVRGAAAHVQTVWAMGDRYREHHMTARFLEEHWAGQTVMVNDLGVPSWRYDGRLLDIFGLGSNRAVALRLQPEGYTANDVRDWASDEGVSLAVVQVGWGSIMRVVPDEWEVVCIWELPRKAIFGDRHVAFYSPNPTLTAKIHGQMKEFEDELPADVRVIWFEPGTQTWGAFEMLEIEKVARPR